MSVGNRNRPSDQTHWAKIMDIVAKIGSSIARNLARCQPVRHHSAFILNAMPQLDAELGRAGLDDGVDFLAHDQHWYPN
jgi:hypothetical protein